MNNHNIGIFRRCEAFYMRSKIEKYGLAPLEARLLSITKNECCDYGCTQEALGDCLNMDKGRIAKALSSLEDKQLICRRTNEKDKRQKFVSLTPEGEAMYERIAEIYELWDEICYAGFSDEERRMHQDFLRRITENAVKYRKGADNND